MTELGIFEIQEQKKRRYVTTFAGLESARYHQAYPSVLSAHASSRSTSSQDQDRASEVLVPVLVPVQEMESLVRLSVEDYETRHSLDEKSGLFNKIGVAWRSKGALSYDFDTTAVVDWSPDRST